ncbi:MAG TPA: hypothetical protein VN181_05335, partial [Thermoanaerobaculia bacterium]|nr:hypothetical protein [Thermoanaerobaculia bacterium]
ALVSTFVVSPLPRTLRFAPLTTFAHLQIPDWALTFWLLSPYSTREWVKAVHDAMATLDSRVIASRIRIALATDERASLARTRMPLIDIRATRDRLVWKRQRPRILAARPDAQLADMDGPHGLLLTRPVEVWGVLQVQCARA